MEDIIKDIEAIAARLRALGSGSAYVGSAINALACAKDNLRWHDEAEAAKAKAAAAAPAQS